MNKRVVLSFIIAILTLNIGMIANAAEYTVEKGDSLCRISQDVYGVQSMWKDIYKVNKNYINDPNVIYIGQVLIIPDSYYMDLRPEDIDEIDNISEK